MVNKQPHVSSKVIPTKPNNYLHLSIFNMLCCTLLGFIPLYYSLKVNTSCSECGLNAIVGSCIHTHVHTYRYTNISYYMCSDQEIILQAVETHDTNIE